jgi:hypothetical protein
MQSGISLRDATAIPPYWQERNMGQTNPSPIHVLAALAAADLDALLPHLRSVELPM